MKKKPLDAFSLRLPPADRLELAREAAADRRTLSQYIRLLIETHPGRKRRARR